MRKLMLVVTLALAGAAAGLFSPSPAKAAGSCVTYCTTPNACGYVCCYRECCNGRCFILDCAAPPPCGGDS
jgi:hypothetical protein